MKVTLQSFLTALPQIGATIAGVAPVAQLLGEIVESFTNPDDQEVAREAIEDLAADNDAGHARLQAKLERLKGQ